MRHPRTRPIAIAAAAVAGVATAVLAVTAPMPSSAAPAPPTDAEVRALAVRVIANTWDSTGLPGEQPMVLLGDVERTRHGSYSDALSECMSDGGHQVLQSSWGEDDGYQILDSGGSPIEDPAVQRAWFDCVVEHPLDSFGSELTLSASEKKWMIDRQVQWTAPCVLLHGEDLPAPPLAGDPYAFFWSAYQEVWTTSSQAEAQRIEADCGYAESTPASSPGISISGYVFRNTGG